MTDETGPEAGAEELREALRVTTEMLGKCMRSLGKSGRPDEASRLGGRAWVALYKVAPREAERINGVMHFLARLPAEADAPPIGGPQPII